MQKSSPQEGPAHPRLSPHSRRNLGDAGAPKTPGERREIILGIRWQVAITRMPCALLHRGRGRGWPRATAVPRSPMLTPQGGIGSGVYELDEYGLAIEPIRGRQLALDQEQRDDHLERLLRLVGVQTPDLGELAARVREAVREPQPALAAFASDAYARRPRTRRARRGSSRPSGSAARPEHVPAAAPPVTTGYGEHVLRERARRVVAARRVALEARHHDRSRCPSAGR